MGLIISIVNQKGGTGKTTTTINLGRALKERGYETLLCDLDPQGNLCYSLDIHEERLRMEDVLASKEDLKAALVEREGMAVIPGVLGSEEFGEGRLPDDDPGKLLRPLKNSAEDFEYVLLDCPPASGPITKSALAISDRVLIPMLMDVLSIQGLYRMQHLVEDVQEKWNPDLRIMGVLAVMVDGRRQLTYEVLEFIDNNFEMAVFNNHIRENVRAAEAPSHGMSVIEYAPESNSSKDYRAAGNEFLKMRIN